MHNLLHFCCSGRKIGNCCMKYFFQKCPHHVFCCWIFVFAESSETSVTVHVSSTTRQGNLLFLLRRVYVDISLYSILIISFAYGLLGHQLSNWIIASSTQNVFVCESLSLAKFSRHSLISFRVTLHTLYSPKPDLIFAISNSNKTPSHNSFGTKCTQSSQFIYLINIFCCGC